MTALTGGFTNPPHDAAHAFRAAMGAMARPGTIHDLTGATPPAPLSVAAGTLILTLCDPDTPLHLAGELENAALREWITFHTGARFVRPQEAMFGIGTWDALLPLSQWSIGTPDYPDRAATLIVEQAAITTTGARLTGPGIRTEAALNLTDIAALQQNAALYPLGLDLFVTAGTQIAALPRSTRIG